MRNVKLDDLLARARGVMLNIANGWNGSPVQMAEKWLAEDAARAAQPVMQQRAKRKVKP